MLLSRVFGANEKGARIGKLTNCVLTNGESSTSTDHLLYIGSLEKPIQEKTGLVWVFSFSEEPLQDLCRGIYPEPI